MVLINGNGQWGLSMNRFFRIVSAGVLTVLVGATAATADEYLGSYVARISEQDHQASDGYALDTAAQMVRQDRANWHKFGNTDSEDENDPWFRTNQQRARFEKLLGQGGAISAATPTAMSRRFRSWRLA